MSSDIPNPTLESEATAAEENSTSLLDITQEQTTAALSKITSNSNGIGDMSAKVLRSVEKAPAVISDVWGEYNQPLTLIALALLAIVSVAIADGILDVLNAIPLVAPSLELIGLGYTGWFIWRYLIYAEKRQELATDYEALKNRILGRIKDDAS